MDHEDRKLFGVPMEPEVYKRTYCEPAVLWRLYRTPNDTALATVVPHWRYATLVWWINGGLEGAHDYGSLHAVIAEAEHLRVALGNLGWNDVD